MPSLWPHMGGNPLGSLPGELLGSPSVEVGKANLPPDLIGDLGKILGRPLCRLLGQIVCRLVASHHPSIDVSMCVAFYLLARCPNGHNSGLFLDNHYPVPNF